MQHRRSLSELEWGAAGWAGGAGRGAAHRSAWALGAAPAPPAPPRLQRLHRLAHIMLLRDHHAAPGPARRALDTFRGVKKILEPHPGSASCASLASPPRAASRAHDPCDDARAASLPSSPALSRRGSLDARAPRTPEPAELRRRGSCESGIFSVANEELCPQRGAAGRPRAAVCPCSLVGCHRCWWWRREPDERAGGGAGAAPGEARARLCGACLAQYDRALDARTPRRAPPDAAPHDEASPFLCGRPDADCGAGSAERLCEYHILARCCCGPGSGGLRGRAAAVRTSSVYTDSSEDVASLAGSDSLYCDERVPRHVRSAQISKIVEYFERQGAEFTCAGGAGGRAASRWRLARKCPQQRLLVCEGAVRSKLPLFDKKS